MERPARHFIGRPQPLITEDRGNVQAELTTFHRYRDYLGIIGPMPNIKPNMGAMMKIPAFLQALQQRNEMLGFTGGNTIPPQLPHSTPVQSVKQIQAPPPPPVSQTEQHFYPQTQAPPQINQFQPPLPFPVPLNIRQAIQRLQPQQAARILNELLQKQHQQRFVDDLERSALMSPTPPLTEYDYPHDSGRTRHGLTSKKVDESTVSVRKPDERIAPGVPGTVPRAREESPPEEIMWENGPVDHLDCAEYYESINPKPKGKTKENGLGATGIVLGPSSRIQRNEKAHDFAITKPKPPSYLSPEEVKKFDNCVSRLQMIATMVQDD
ncbi:unnamed protein product [Strongylus vulgaris]|uniref:Uncharacterized protein n=1 Tax=Strongylus vulgaris TaxID=40348 RepID=A0A3P7KVZ3_STRVU|nr:unnamed protein product [Strongylus vulgaris]